jgi:glycosyltransferase involved in cell wall biosynthesis
MPRVLSISHSYVVALNRRLVHEMGRIGGPSWEMVAVGPSFFRAEQGSLAAEATSKDDSFVFEPVPAALTGGAHLLLYGWRLRELLRVPRDLVHAWEEPFVLPGAQIATWTPRRTPLVFASFQNIAKKYPPPFAQLERFAVGRSAGIIAGGKTVAEALRSKSLYSKRPMRIIPLGVDVKRFSPDPARGAEVRRRLGWNEPAPPVVGFLGRFEHSKGVLLLCRVLDRLRVPWRALLVGTGPLEGSLRQWASTRPGRVRILTDVHHDNVPEHLNAMDLLCAPSQTTPSWREQVGRMLIEAFASGVAVVASASGEIPHTVGEAGLVVDESDEEVWGSTIEQLLSDARERARMAAAGLERARTHYAWPVIARAHLSFFEELLSSRSTTLAS